MRACNSLYIIVICLLVLGWTSRLYAEGDVTVLQAPPVTTSTSATTTASDGTPVVHVSSHKKKKKTSVASSSYSGDAPLTASTSGGATAANVTSIGASATNPSSLADPAPAPSKTVVTSVAFTGLPQVPPANSINTAPASVEPQSTGPAVETMLPVARHSGSDLPNGTIVASAVPGPSIVSQQGTAYPAPPGVDPTGLGGGLPAGEVTPVATKHTHTYPWKHDIITTEFWIGEGGSSVSATANYDSAWVQDWRSSYHGSDRPDDRQGYLPASHAPTLNPFYVALPFNDLAYPDQARRWLPDNWRPRYEDGKQVSTCKDRWVEIKNSQGDTCYAQWEDVGPLTSDHPEYVFGSERPDTLTRAGLDVSPAVAKYLSIQPEGGNRVTSWRFVDAEDVPPGYWLKYDEDAVIYAALHELNNKHMPGMDDDGGSIQRSIAPPDDQLDSDKKKVGAAKG